MSSYTKSIYVDVDLDEFEDDDIIEYMQSRGYTIYKSGEGEMTEAHRIYELLKVGAANADQLARDFICAAANRIAI